MEFLLHLSENIQRKKENVSAPSLIHSDLTMVSGSSAIFCLLTSIESSLTPKRNTRISFPSLTLTCQAEVRDHPLRGERTHLRCPRHEMEIDKISGRKVWLKSGGYIVIDMAEALVAIDVNTGRYVGKELG